MSVNVAQVSLLISAVVCCVSVLTYRANKHERALQHLKDQKDRDLDNQKWRTEVRDTMARLEDTVADIKGAQNHLRELIDRNAQAIQHNTSERLKATYELRTQVDELKRNENL